MRYVAFIHSQLSTEAPEAVEAFHSQIMENSDCKSTNLINENSEYERPTRQRRKQTTPTRIQQIDNEFEPSSYLYRIHRLSRKNLAEQLILNYHRQVICPIRFFTGFYRWTQFNLYRIHRLLMKDLVQL